MAEPVEQSVLPIDQSEFFADEKYIFTMITWPRGPMDKASAYGAGDCRFESCRGQSLIEALMMEQQSGELVNARSNVGTVRRRANAE